MSFNISSIIRPQHLLMEKLITSLDNIGVKAFDSIGEEFNIEHHEAIMTKKTKSDSNIVVEEYEKGYKYDDKVIKHSKVIVSKG